MFDEYFKEIALGFLGILTTAAAAFVVLPYSNRRRIEALEIKIAELKETVNDIKDDIDNLEKAALGLGDNK